MPLLGEIVAATKSPEELADEIQKILVDRYMKEPPHVQVIVVDVRSKNYFLQGEVNRPGKYPLVVPTTIMQALVNAGGFRDFANKKDIRIQRGSQFLRFNYVEASEGEAFGAEYSAAARRSDFRSLRSRVMHPKYFRIGGN